MTKIHTTVICDVDGTLTDGHVYVGDDGRETLRFNKRDGWLIARAASKGIEVVLVTVDPSEGPGLDGPAKHRARKLGLPLVWCADAEAKASVVRDHKREGKRVVYIGDGPQDVEALMAADAGFVPRGAAIGIGNRTARLAARGGEGVLHEVLGYLLDHPVCP